MILLFTIYDGHTWDTDQLRCDYMQDNQAETFDWCDRWNTNTRI